MLALSREWLGEVSAVVLSSAGVPPETDAEARFWRWRPASSVAGADVVRQATTLFCAHFPILQTRFHVVS